MGSVALKAAGTAWRGGGPEAQQEKVPEFFTISEDDDEMEGDKAKKWDVQIEKRDDGDATDDEKMEGEKTRRRGRGGGDQMMPGK